ncbi:MAG: IPT/TIG domain-containing protein [Myxococcota bacterium]
MRPSAALNTPILRWAGLSLCVFAAACSDTGGSTIIHLDDTSEGFVPRKLKVLSVDPAEGPIEGGQLLAITGTGFQSDMTVTFGGAEASFVIVGGDELAVMRTPPGAAEGQVDITVALTDGRSVDVPNAYTYVKTDPAGEDLIVLGVTPATGPLPGGNLVVVEGRGFVEGAEVTFGLVPATEVHVIGPDAITCTAPTGLALGAVDLHVKTPATASRPALQDTLPAAYTYTPVDVIDTEVAVLSATPSQGAMTRQTLVTIGGKGFADGTAVFFGDVRATDVHVLGPNALTCMAPTSVVDGRVDVRVEVPGGHDLPAQTATLPDGFHYIDDSTTLVVSSLLPDSGPVAGQNRVVIAGQGFADGATVEFNGTPAGQVTFLAPTALSCVAPAGAAPSRANITVKLPNGDVYTLQGGYTYTDDTVPLRVNGVFPASGVLAGDNVITISGQGFVVGSTVTIGGNLATEPVVLGDSAIVCKAPAGAAPGAVTVQVETPDHQSATMPNGYTYLDPGDADRLLVLNVTPGEGSLAGGETVSISGSGFVPGAEVYFGGVQATDVQVLAPEAMTLTVPPGVAAGLVDIRVQLPGPDGAADTLYNGYEYLPVAGGEDLMVFRAIPNQGVVSGGNVVALEGRGFVDGAKVFFGGAPASEVQVLSSRAITCVAPMSQVTGLVGVRVELPGQGALAFTLDNGYRYLPVDLAELKLATVYPIQGKVTGGELVLITGTGFDPAMSVRFGDVSSPLVQVLSPSSATALVPPHVDGLVDVELVNPDTTVATLPAGFRYVADETVDLTQGPALGGVLPAKGPSTGGTIVRVIGANFAPGAALYVGATRVTTMEVLSPSLIGAQVPAGAVGTTAVKVVNPDGKDSSLAGGWTYMAPGTAPTLTDVWPAMGPSTGGTWVSIIGTGFQTGTTAWFGLTPAATTWVSPTELIAEAPSHAVGTVDLTLVRPDGEVARRVSGFAYYSASNLPAPPPVVGDVFPRVGTIDGGTDVSVIGSGFATDARIYFGTRRATLVRATEGSIRTVTTPPGPAGSARVTVVNPDGLTSSKADAFVYFAPPPLIRQIDPNVGSNLGGTVVTITGKNFRSDSEVALGDRTITTFITATSTKLMFYAPPSDPMTVDVSVINADGQADVAPLAFSWVDVSQAGAPQVTSIEPDHGPAAGGYLALIHGAHFAPGASVEIDGNLALGTEFIDSTIMKVIIPPGQVGPPVDVTVLNGNLEGTLSGGFTYEAETLAPLTVRTVTPGLGPTTGGTVLTVEGSGFTSDSAVIVGSTAAARVTYISPSNLTVVTPPGLPGLVNISVSRPDLSQATAFNAFAYQRPETLGQGPRVTSVDPAIGPMVGGSLVTITGSQFNGPASVYFGSQKAPVVHVLDSTHLTVRTPATTSSGTVAVAVINADGLIGVLPGGYSYYDAAGVAPPEVFLAQPNSGSTFGNEAVKILGDLFQPGARTYFCERPAIVQSLDSNSTLNVLTPANDPGPCKITVVNPDGLTADRDNKFTYQSPAPIVTSVTPSAGPKEGGIDIVVQGQNFVTGATVRFGNAVSPQAIVVDPRTLTARLPASVVGVVDVVVVNPGATQATGTLPHGFTYLDQVSGLSPVVSQVLPPKGPLAGGTPVRILGDHFDQGALLILNGVTVQNATVTDVHEMRFTAPAADAPGPVPLTILNPDGLGVTLASGFTYEVPSATAPTITSVVPGSGPEGGNTTLTITGSGFSAGGNWSLGGQPLSTAATISPNLVTAKTPPSAPGKADLLYVGADGQVALKLQAFEYVAAPKLTAISPALGGVAGGTEVTLIGDNMKPGMKVFFGGNQGEVLFVQSVSTATARTPPSLIRGFVDVTVRNTDGQEGKLTAGFEYLDPPDVQAVWPPMGPNSGGTLVQVKGKGMHYGSKVFFGAVQATTVYYDSYGLLIALSPPPTASNTVDIRVLNLDGREDTLPQAFTYKPLSALGPAPAITAVFPPRGPTTGGTRASIDGLNFDPNGQAIFVPTPGTNAFVRSDRAIVVAPAHALGPANLYWVNPDGRTTQAPVDFVYLDPSSVGPTPAIREITPLRGPTAGNTLVTLLGTGFQSGSRVRFGADDAINVSTTPTNDQVRTPSEAPGSVEVWLVNPDGTQVLSQTPFLYLPPPDVTAVNPKRGPANGGTMVTIDGNDFRADPDGLIPQILLCTSYDPVTGAAQGCAEVDPTKIQAPEHGHTLTFPTPAHEPALVDVAVIAPDGQRDVLLDAFTYTAVPLVAGIDPDAGPTNGGQLVTITGAAFQAGAYVLFDGKPATEVSVQSAAVIKCKTPGNAPGPSDVTIGNPDGGLVVDRDAYLYLPAPTVDKLIPNAGPEDGGTESTIQGLNFVGVANSPTKPRVFFGTVEVPAADVTWLSSTAIRVMVPAGTGTVDVKVRNPDGQEGLAVDGFTYLPPLAPPTVTYVLPDNGSTLGGDVLRVYGNAFLSGARVYLGKPDANGNGVIGEPGVDWYEAPGQGGTGSLCEVRNNSTLLVCKTPAHPAGKVDVRVVNSDGQEDSIADSFTFIPPPEEQPISIINIEPRRSTLPGGKYITIGGTGFKEGTTVRFFKDVGGVASAPFAESTEVLRLGPTLIRAKVPPSPTGQPTKIIVRVRNPGLAGEFADAKDKFEYVSGPVFERHPGDRLPNEAFSDRGALVFDANGDGYNDVLVYRDNDDRLLINGWQGRVGYFYEVDFPGYNGFYTDQAQAVDYDGDGDLDIIRMYAANSYMQRCTNLGGGNFAACEYIYQPNCPSVTFAMGDLSCDGVPDIILPFNTTDPRCRPTLLKGDGHGGFAAYNSMLPPFAEPTRGIAVGDIDNDGDNDLLLANDLSVQNRLYLNNCADLQLSGKCDIPIPDFSNKLFEGKNYALAPYGTDWYTARNTCLAWGADLVRLDSQAEADFIRLDPMFPRDYIWLGMRDTNNDHVKEWVTPGVSEYTDWCGGYPSQNGGWDCVTYAWNAGNGGQDSCMHDYPCSPGWRFVCEGQGQTCAGAWTFVDAQYGIGKTFPVSGGNSYDALLIDIDNDNDLDAVVAQYGQPTNVYANIGGRFAADDGLRWPQVEANRNIEKLHPVDIDNDGDLDLIGRYTGNEVKVYLNDRFTRGEPDGAGVFSDVTSTRWPNGNGKDPRTDVVGFAPGDLNDDDLPDLYIVGRDRGDRIVLNDGYREGSPWRDDKDASGNFIYHVGIGKFAFNTSRVLPERYDNVNAATLGDFDGDGDIDIAQCGYYQKMQLYLNDGAAKWVDASADHLPANITWRCRAGSIQSADIDDDGDLDILVEASADGYSCPNNDCVGRAMLVNDGFGHFTDVAPTQVPYGQDWGAEKVTFADLDHDGDLDWLVSYDWGGTPNRVYINGGDPFDVGGAFAFSRTDAWMANVVYDRRYYIRDMETIDLNGDAFPDIYTGRSGQNKIWLNNGGTSFTDVTAQYSPSTDNDARKVLVDDFDNDGDQDVYVINWGQDRFHYRETTKFADITGSALPAVSDQSLGGDSGDLDLDGFTDIYVANSSQQNRMYLNLGGTEFQDLTGNLPVDWHDSQEAYLYDFDGDCDLDIYVVNYADQDRIYINTLDPLPGECPAGGPLKHNLRGR